MKITLMGHATVLVELDAATVLIDPVFYDPYEDGAVTSCPAREIHVDKLPKIDVLVITHAHLDHFDVRSLDKIHRDCAVFCPEDPVIPYVLAKLGFANVRTLEAGAVVDVGQGQMFTTFSNINVIEFGLVFKDRSGTFWNEVDTVITPGTIEYTKMQVGHIDLLFSAFACQNLGLFSTMRAGYPLDIPRKNLSNVRQIAPTLVVPGSAGFRFFGPLAWSNSLVFPISRDRFLDDLARVAPEIASTIANPGDVFEIADGKVIRDPGASTIARMVEDDTNLIEFDATAPVPALIDENLLGYSEELIQQQVDETIEGMLHFVVQSYPSADPLVDALRKAHARFALRVIFPDTTERWVHVCFEKDAPTIASRASGALRNASVMHAIAASVLAARARYETSYCYYRGFSRLTHTLAGTTNVGTTSHEQTELPDLLSYYLDCVAPGVETASFRRLDFQLSKHTAHRRNGTHVRPLLG